jgi:hypothetical protein
MLSTLSQTANFNHATPDQRLEAREVHSFIPRTQSRTLSALKEAQRRDTNEYNMKTFSSVVVGIHGHELPKFKDTEYWKFKPDYVQQPLTATQSELLKRQRFWMHEGSSQENRSFVSGKKVKQLAEKPNLCVPKPLPDREKHGKRWTSLMQECQASMYTPVASTQSASRPLNETANLSSEQVLSDKSKLTLLDKHSKKLLRTVLIRSSGFKPS